MHGHNIGRQVVLGALVILSAAVSATERPVNSHAAYTADWECRAFSDGDWLCRTSSESDFTVPLDAIASKRSSIPNTLSALQKRVSPLAQVAPSEKTSMSHSMFSTTPDVRRLIMMLQREEAFTILWYVGNNRAEAKRMRHVVDHIDDAMLLALDGRDGKEYVIVSGLFPDQAAARRDLNKHSVAGHLASLQPSPLRVRDLSRHTISLPD